MSGGSMEYLCYKVGDASFRTHTPERKAFMKHLQLVAAALHDIEWVDSGDYGPGRENEAIRFCLQPGAILAAAIEDARQVRDQLTAEIDRASAGKSGSDSK